MNTLQVKTRGSLGKVSLCLIMAIASFSLVSSPAHAQFTTIEAPGPLLTAALTNAGAGSATAAATTFEATAKKILDGLAWSVAKMTVQSITKSTVNWINSGFNGSPAFVSDLQTNLQNLQDAVANDFFAQLNKATVSATGFNITSPFQDQVNSKLLAEYNSASTYYGINSYTLNQCSQDPSAFLNQGHFTSGGFTAFFCANQNPANNPFGSYLQASNALWTQLDKQVQQRESELNWGKGFLPWRGSCAKSISDLVNTTPATFSSSDLSATTTISTDFTNLTQADTCHNAPVKTPGSVIETQLEGALGSGIQQLNLADSINEIVGALMSQLVNQVLGSGGLLSTSQPSAGGGSSYISQAADPSQYTALNTSLADGFVTTLANERTQLTTYVTEWQVILNAANTAQQRCGVADDITTVITSATNAITSGNTAIAQVDSITKQIAAAESSGNQTTIATVLSNNQSFLASAPLSASDLSEAQLQSSDTSTTTDATATSTDSLYTQMQRRAAACLARNTAGLQ